MLFKRPKHRVFDYEPRYYKPEEDDVEKRKKRLKFRYARNSKKKKSPIMLFIVGLLILVYAYFKLSGG